MTLIAETASVDSSDRMVSDPALLLRMQLTALLDDFTSTNGGTASRTYVTECSHCHRRSIKCSYISPARVPAEICVTLTRKSNSTAISLPEACVNADDDELKAALTSAVGKQFTLYRKPAESAVIRDIRPRRPLY